MSKELRFQLGDYPSSVIIQENIPRLEELYPGAGEGGKDGGPGALLVCDENTAPLARRVSGDLPLTTLPPGEEHKGWKAVETILRDARRGGLGRDGLFIGVGGGAVCDLTAFAASIYMRGAALRLIPTTLLCVVDAALGGKTGFDLGGIKNLAGTFYPAERIVIALEALETLPPREWKSGAAELIKAAVLDGDAAFLERLQRPFTGPGGTPSSLEALVPLLERALTVKGRIVEADPREQFDGETGGGRILLNLGHTFGHALEAALGLGTISHGEAVAWGLARSLDLGAALGITPPGRETAIREVLEAWGYETAVPYPGGDAGFDRRFREALENDKKKKAGKPRFVVPGARGARVVPWSLEVEACLYSLLSKR
ncbi:MAG: 3-dehydroquinate synthase [Treponema sp.]|nr:3-dehydroquinate synthase [Treponema sp.]